MDITVSPHWHIRPGEHVYLWLPHAGSRSCFQLQPFYVAYWDDAPGPRILYILTRPQASSLSTRLYLREWLHWRRQPALLLGPYGRSIDFSLFGTIVFIVEDIGILRMLPYIRMLVQASEERWAMVRKLKIGWQMQDFDHQCWLGDWMQDLLDLDRSEFKILEFRLYYLRKGTSANPGDGFGERIKLCQGPLMAREIAQGHLSKRRGKLAVGGRFTSHPIDSSANLQRLRDENASDRPCWTCARRLILVHPSVRLSVHSPTGPGCRPASDGAGYQTL
ncbi:NADPH oxidase family protein [Aspergillus luchuensis]|uniref:FAD-binding FR-type domain-containing protein n=1 Tax=Aspergillus kawachii TaxID=1069201 RepID=A0A7R8A0B7_ASPKA|nr:uncharacterized protein AKAW2_50533S [Aspergillus luchuensis]BCS00192.1 hypothetical protein AKAW2_50533S [Aspergillus luchuensis]